MNEEHCGNSSNSLKSSINSALEYVSKNVGFVTLATTIAFAMISTAFKFLIYAYNCGKFDSLGISHCYINTDDENSFYSFFLYLSFGIIFLVANWIPYYNITGNKKLLRKIINCAGIVLIFSVLGTVYQVWHFRSILAGFDRNNIIFFVFRFFEISLLLSFMIFLPGILVGIVKKLKSQKNKISKSNENSASIQVKNPQKLIAIFLGIVIAMFALYTAFIYVIGYSSSNNVRTYKVIDTDKNHYVVLYENSSIYIVTKCEYTGSVSLTVDDKASQNIIAKTNTPTKTIVFTWVDIK
ncbi:MAG TPA: hypothetical protein VHP31_02025 [Caproicibacter sp.]|nr:hypothetical protein [Caproicibacter sp.]